MQFLFVCYCFPLRRSFSLGRLCVCFVCGWSSSGCRIIVSDASDAMVILAVLSVICIVVQITLTIMCTLSPHSSRGLHCPQHYGDEDYLHRCAFCFILFVASLFVLLVISRIPLEWLLSVFYGHFHLNHHYWYNYYSNFLFIIDAVNSIWTTQPRYVCYHIFITNFNYPHFYSCCLFLSLLYLRSLFRIWLPWSPILLMHICFIILLSHCLCKVLIII